MFACDVKETLAVSSHQLAEKAKTLKHLLSTDERK